MKKGENSHKNTDKGGVNTKVTGKNTKASAHAARNYNFECDC